MSYVINQIISLYRNSNPSIQYNAAFTVTGAIKYSSREKQYQELGLESLGMRRRYLKLFLIQNYK